MSGCHELELRLDVENTRLDRTEQVRVLDFSFEPQILKCIFLINVERGTFCHETLYLLKPLFKHSLTDELLLTSSERNHQNNSCRKFITFIK